MKEKLKAWAAEADFYARRNYKDVETEEQARALEFYHDAFQRKFAQLIATECSTIAYNHSPEAAHSIVEAFLNEK